MLFKKKDVEENKNVENNGGEGTPAPEGEAKVVKPKKKKIGKKILIGLGIAGSIGLAVVKVLMKKGSDEVDSTPYAEIPGGVGEALPMDDVPVSSEEATE